MKAILIILVVALGGLTYKFQLDAKSAKAKMIAAEDAEHAAKSEAKEATDELKEATSKIEKLEKLNADYLAEIDTLKRVEIAAVVAPAGSEPSGQSAIDRINAKEAESRAKLVELRQIYDRNLAEINSQKAALTANLTKARAIEKNLRDNAPTFSEHGIRKNPDMTTSTVGVRMSAADRKELIEKHQASLTQIADQIGAIVGEITALDSRALALDQSYETALEKARRE